MLALARVSLRSNSACVALTTAGAIDNNTRHTELTIDMTNTTQRVTVSPKFQVVIPLAERQRLQLQPGTQLSVVAFNGGLRMMPVLPPSAFRGLARGALTDIQRDADRRL